MSFATKWYFYDEPVTITIHMGTKGESSYDLYQQPHFNLLM